MKKDIDEGTSGPTTTLDLYSYAVKVTLDIIGDAGFDHEFGALENKVDRLRHILDGTTANFVKWTKRDLFSQYATELLPSAFISLLFRLPSTRLGQLRVVGKNLVNIVEQIVGDKTDSLVKGLEGGKDLMSLLIRANAKEKQSNKLSDIELMSEIGTLVMAGHVTTANLLSWALWELAKDIELQSRIRKEIAETTNRAREKGQMAGIEFDEYDNMTLLVAFMKEVVRYHPVLWVGGRQALEDSVIPLSHPVELESGTIVNEIPVSKGQQIWVNIPGYNRLPELFGDDADNFNVDRWIHREAKQSGVGIYSNLMTFAHGPRACIGWRFSILEMQALLIRLISDFEFSLPADESSVYRTPSPVMAPSVSGKRAFGPMLPLNVTVIGE